MLRLASAANPRALALALIKRAPPAAFVVVGRLAVSVACASSAIACWSDRCPAVQAASHPRRAPRSSGPRGWGRTSRRCCARVRRGGDGRLRHGVPSQSAECSRPPGARCFPSGIVARSLGFLVRLRAVPERTGRPSCSRVHLRIFADPGRPTTSGVGSGAAAWRRSSLRRRAGRARPPVSRQRPRSARGAFLVLPAPERPARSGSRVILASWASWGDLAESMLKRRRGQGFLGPYPGHGGLLDRTDSLLFAGPVVYYYYRWLM